MDCKECIFKYTEADELKCLHHHDIPIECDLFYPIINIKKLLEVLESNRKILCEYKEACYEDEYGHGWQFKYENEINKINNGITKINTLMDLLK
jgi:hypothetical protein